MDYIKLCYNVFNEDYARIVNMEEIAEQSFDEMQAFLLLHEKTGEKITEASEKMNQAITAFAAKNNVTLIEGSDDFGLKLKQAGRLNRYSDRQIILLRKTILKSKRNPSRQNPAGIAPKKMLPLIINR